MEFPKRLLVVADIAGLVASETLAGFEPGVLPDGGEVGVYGLLRVKRIEVTRKLVKLDGDDSDDGDISGRNDQSQIPLLTVEE